jgi:hypothetical protein
MPAITLNKPALRDFYNSIVQSPQAKLDASGLDQLIAIVGEKKGGLFGGSKSTSDVAKELKAAPDLETRLAIAKNGLDATKAADLKALLADADFAARLDPVVANFLKALVGLEPLAGVDAMATNTTVNRIVADPKSPEVQATAKLRDLIKTGKLQSYYDVMIGATTNPALKAEAEALFNALPTVAPGMSADEFVKAGLWTMAPRGIEEMQKSARYLPGRQVLVETNVYAKIPAGSTSYDAANNAKIGAYDASGPKAITYRATLVGEDPANKNNFLVKVDGNANPVSVTKQSIYKHNHPHTVERNNIKSDTKRDVPWGWTKWQLDYASPLAKAKLCEIALKMDEYVQKLDFTKTKTEATSGAIGVMFGRGDTAKKMVEMQKSCVETVFRSIDMKYPKGTPFNDPGRVTDNERDVAKQAIRGTGMCVQQSAVFGALLTPFMDVLGVDAQYRSGNCFRNIKKPVENVFAPDYSSGHGWWQVTFRPSMEMTVTDRTWNQVNLPLDRAYGFPYGDRYGSTDISGYVAKPLASTDVDVSGKVSAATFDRQFSRVGDGRENHISNSQDG